MGVDPGGRKRLTKNKKEFQALVLAKRRTGQANGADGKWYSATLLRCVVPPLPAPRAKSGKVKYRGDAVRYKVEYCKVFGCQAVTGGGLCKRHLHNRGQEDERDFKYPLNIQQMTTQERYAHEYVQAIRAVARAGLRVSSETIKRLQTHIDQKNRKTMDAMVERAKNEKI
jgi:hypothetical protein